MNRDCHSVNAWRKKKKKPPSGNELQSHVIHTYINSFDIYIQTDKHHLRRYYFGVTTLINIHSVHPLTHIHTNKQFVAPPPPKKSGRKHNTARHSVWWERCVFHCRMLWTNEIMNKWMARSWLVTMFEIPPCGWAHETTSEAVFRKPHFQLSDTLWSSFGVYAVINLKKIRKSPNIELILTLECWATYFTWSFIRSSR